ncbi:Sodium/hydrogen exchanger family-domain-containing protein [Chytridium lagenaria]|nr:Sodium/hydrogen exchanger family-domain-containing protein [Chytridium lagenaria]
MIATAAGAIIGPHVLNLFNPLDRFGGSLDTVTLEFSRVVIAIQVMACGVDLPAAYIRKEWFSMFMLIVPNMIVKWVVSGLGVWWIFGGTLLDGLVIAACLTPTDPVLANSIVKGKFAERHIPENVRLILAAESGMNDGLGTPFLFLALYLLRRGTAGEAIGDWAWRVVIYQIIVGAVIGVAMAVAARIALRKAVEKDWVDRESLWSFTIMLAIFVMGIVSLYGGDDILAVFIAGNVLAWDGWFPTATRPHFQETLDYLLNLCYFTYFGAIFPWTTVGSTVGLWKLVMWFGPMGASAVFYAVIARVYLAYPSQPLYDTVLFVVLASIVVHGGSVPLFHFGLTYGRKEMGMGSE